MLDFGTVPGWITSAGVLGILGIVVRWQLGLRKLNVEAQQVSVNAQQVHNADEADIRDHYAQEVAVLRQRLDEKDERHREAMATADLRHDQCIKSRDDMRKRLEVVEDRLLGTIRQFVTFQQKVGLAIPPAQRSPEIAAAIANLQPFIDKMSEWNGAGK